MTGESSVIHPEPLLLSLLTGGQGGSQKVQLPPRQTREKEEEKGKTERIRIRMQKAKEEEYIQRPERGKAEAG